MHSWGGKPDYVVPTADPLHRAGSWYACLLPVRHARPAHQVSVRQLARMLDMTAQTSPLSSIVVFCVTSAAVVDCSLSETLWAVPHIDK